MGPRHRDVICQTRTRNAAGADATAESYDATVVALRAIEAAAKAAGGKLPTREAVAAAVRKNKLEGITGTIAFDGKGDRLKATYFVLQVASDDPAKWGENKLIKRLGVDPPAAKNHRAAARRVRGPPRRDTGAKEAPP